MSLDLFQQEANDRLTALPPVQNVDPGMWDGFIRGTGMATMKGFAKAARAVDLLGAVVPIAQDTFTGGTEAQDKYFAGHDAIFGRAVDYWTPKPQEVGMAGEVMGSLLSVLPQVIVSPSMAVATTQLGTAEDLANVGVTTGKAQAVGAVQALTLGTGIWMPILGANLWQRAVIGGAGFNLVQGTAARAVSGAILADTPAKDMFKAFDAEAMTLDVLMGLAFGGLVHLSPTQRAQGAAAWDKIESWAKNLNPSDKAAIATLREAQHLNVDSTPGKPMGTPDIEAHVNRMRAAIDQLATDQTVSVEDITLPPRRDDYTAAEGGLATVREAQDRQAYVAGAAQFLAEMPEGGRFDDGLGGVWTVTRKTSVAGTESVTAHGETNTEIISIQRRPGGEWKFLGDWEGAIHKDTSILPAQDPPGGNQPRFEPDPARTAQAEATVRDLQAAAETVRAEEGIPPPPQEPPRVVQSVRRTIEEELSRAGRPAEEAAAGAAIWDAFYTTMAKRIGTTVDQLWAQFPLARITNEMPGGQALKQGPGGEQVITVGGKDRPITNSDGRRIAADIEELKAFWNWFKDSKVVDKSGKPMAVYHGTNYKFSTFDSSQIGKSSYDEGIIGAGFYFSDNKDYAETYGAPIEVYLSLQNPLVITHSNFNDVLILTGGKDLWPNGNASLYKRLEYAIAGKGKLFTKKVMDAGYDGIVFRDAYETNEGLSSEYIAFRPEQIKSAIGNRGTFDPKNPDILYQDKENTWYKSALGEAITNLNMKQGDAKAWLQALKGLGNKGVKAEEVKWSGIEEWLQLQEGKITKEQVQEFLANNGVKVEEVMLGGAKTKNLGDPQIAGDLEIMRAAGFPPYQNPDDASMLAFLDTKTDDVVLAEDIATWAKEDPELQAAADAAGRIERYWYSGDQNDSSNAMTKYGSYQLPGGENYRELLLTLPERPKPQSKIETKVEEIGTHDGDPVYRVSRGDVKADIHHNAGFPWRVDLPDGQSMGGYATAELAIAAATRRIEQIHLWTQIDTSTNEGQTFQSSHFDQPNILAHVRFNERTDAEGKKVLFIEEFQSDWAQKGKREGFDNENAFQALIKERDQLGESQQDVARYNQITEELGRMQRTMGKGVPSAPFVGKTDAWVSLALKRMITYAAENGFDRVAWTRGEQQVERYTSALRKAVDVIEWTKTDKGVQLTGYKGGKNSKVQEAHEAMQTAERTLVESINGGYRKLLGLGDGQDPQRITDPAEFESIAGWDKTADDAALIYYPSGWVVEKTNGEYFGMATNTDAILTTLPEAEKWLWENWVRTENPPDPSMSPEAAAYTQALNRYYKIRRDEHSGPRQKVVDTTEKEDALSDAIGKAMAEKIISDPNQSGTIEGEGIRIDSTGMAGFYDRIVPKVANEVLKKLGGGKVKDTDITILKDSDAEATIEQIHGPADFKPMDEDDLQAFAGLNDFPDGSRPAMSDATVIINGIEQDVLMTIDPSGVHMANELFQATIDMPPYAAKSQAEAVRWASTVWGSPGWWNAFSLVAGEFPNAKQPEPSKQMAFDITQSMKDKVEGGLPLFQKTKGTERGYMSIGDEGRVIGLLEGADASTFIHESGHFFLDTMAEIGKLPDVPAAVRADLDTALTWMGLKDPAKWVDMTLDEKRPYHEKYARGFEQYLREGKAPSDELKGVFQRFRDWLVELYKSSKSLNVKLNDDIRGVMNRMLADQTRNPSTEAPPAPSERPGSPPPPGVSGEAQAGAEAQMRAMLQDMALNETGWAQEGGKLMDQRELGTGKPSFTTWIPKAEWWPGRPDKKLNAAKVQEAVRKYLAGEKLKPGEQRTVDYMIDIANARNKGIDTVGGMEEYKALAEDAWDEGLDPTTENVVDLDLVARAAAIDEAYVERAALKYENDDAAFRGELEMLIHETERAQTTEAAGRSKAGEQKTKPGQPGETKKPTDIVRAEADLIVEKNPDMPITVGVNPDGTPLTMTAREFLDQARAEAELNRADIPLLEVAAQCLLGVS